MGKPLPHKDTSEPPPPPRTGRRASRRLLTQAPRPCRVARLGHGVVRAQSRAAAAARPWIVLEAKIGNTKADRSDRLGRPVRPVWAYAVQVELGFVL